MFMTTLLIATANRHKLAEIRAILGDRYQYLTPQDFAKAPLVVEDAGTFAGNARKKVRQLAAWLAGELGCSASRASGLVLRGSSPSAPFVLADDSGLEVDALHGAPGVHSARFAALDVPGLGNASDAANNAKLLGLLANIAWEKRTARFRCVIALARVLAPLDPSRCPASKADEWESQCPFFEGVCEGRIGYEPRGEGGFGYDPLFIPKGYSATFAQLGQATKNQLSHRARALVKAREYLARILSKPT
jgi:XTP/dITP diphosphohydrolase